MCFLSPHCPHPVRFPNLWYESPSEWIPVRLLQNKCHALRWSIVNRPWSHCAPDCRWPAGEFPSNRTWMQWCRETHRQSMWAMCSNGNRIRWFCSRHAAFGNDRCLRICEADGPTNSQGERKQISIIHFSLCRTRTVVQMDWEIWSNKKKDINIIITYDCSRVGVQFLVHRIGRRRPQAVTEHALSFPIHGGETIVLSVHTRFRSGICKWNEHNKWFRLSGTNVSSTQHHTQLRQFSWISRRRQGHPVSHAPNRHTHIQCAHDMAYPMKYVLVSNAHQQSRCRIRRAVQYRYYCRTVMQIYFLSTKAIRMVDSFVFTEIGRASVARPPNKKQLIMFFFVFSLDCDSHILYSVMREHTTTSALSPSNTKNRKKYEHEKDTAWT